MAKDMRRMRLAARKARKILLDSAMGSQYTGNYRLMEQIRTIFVTIGGSHYYLIVGRCRTSVIQKARG